MDPEADPARLLSATAVHDGAMLSRIAATLALHPVAAFSYSPTAVDELVEVRIEVLGGDWHQERVLQKVRRLIGVVSAAYAGE
jgi:hypothetical protein